jgi:uncharacterized protein
MSEVSEYAEGTPSWVDLVTPDREAACRFYGGLLGWDFEVGPPETGHYTLARLRNRNVAGIFEMTPEMGSQGVPPNWTTYISVGDADAAAGRVRAAGGTVMQEPLDVMDQGRMAIVQDPTGAVVGLWQPRAHIGAEIVNEPGAICWNELHTRDLERARTFYVDALGWELEAAEFEGMPYVMGKAGGRVVAGMMSMAPQMPADVPPHWLTYFAVDDTDKAVSYVEEQSGRVMATPMDTPAGRMAVVADPQGAPFAVIRMPDQG